jgi:hypothetical protein
MLACILRAYPNPRINYKAQASELNRSFNPFVEQEKFYTIASSIRRATEKTVRNFKTFGTA